ncbi:hypothetical protein FOL47_010241, partial [Perkinsus chesapeaki]
MSSSLILWLRAASLVSTGPTPTGATVEAGLTGAASGVSVTPNSTPPPTGAGEGFARQAGSTPPATQGTFAAYEVPTLNADAAEQSGLYPGAEFMLPAEVVTFIRDKLVPTAQYDVSSVLVRHGIVVPELFKNMGDCAELAGSLSCPSNIYALRALGGVFGPTAQTSDVPPDPALESMRQSFEETYNVHIPSRFLLSAKVFAKIRRGEPVREDECSFSPVGGQIKRRMWYNPASGDIEVAEDAVGMPRSSFGAADLLLNISRWLVGHCILQKLNPAEGLLYLMRLCDNCLQSDIHTLRRLDAELRLEAVSHPTEIGPQLITGNSDIVTCHRESFRPALGIGHGPRTSSSANPSSTICRRFERTGKCSYGDNCIFAHRTGGKGQDGRPQRGRGRASDAQFQASDANAAPIAKRLRAQLESKHDCVDDFEDALRGLQAEAADAINSDIFDDDHFKDGGACQMPGKEDPLSGANQAFGSEFAAILWRAGQSSGFVEALQAVEGQPTEAQVISLRALAEVAAGSARVELHRSLGLAIDAASPANRVDGKLLGILVDRLGVDDGDIGELCREGLPIGISREIAVCPLFPKYNKKVHPPFPNKAIGEGFRNYASMKDPIAIDAVEETLRKEEALGFIKRLDDREAHDGGRSFVPRGAIPKKDGGVRVIDDYLRGNVNLRANVPNTNELPSTACTRRLVGELQQQYPTRKWLIFELDLESAYRFLRVHPDERRHLSFCHEDASGVASYFENCSLPFGLNSSGFWFVRYARAVQICASRILRSWLPCGSAAGLMYVDDGLWLVDPTYYAEVCTVISLLWTALGSRLSFKKMRLGQRAGTFIGVTLEVEPTGSASFFLGADKLAKTKLLLSSLLASESIKIEDLASLSGKLSHYCQLRPFLKPYLQPFFGLKGVMEGRFLKVAKCPRTSEVAVISSFFLSLLNQPHSGHPVGALSRVVCTRSRTVTIACDASLSALGGVIALSGPGGSEQVFFFRTPVREHGGGTALGGWECLLKDVSAPTESRNMVALELLAAALALTVAQKAAGSCSDYNVVLFTDNTATQGILTKMYSPKPALAQLLRSMVETLAALTLTTFIELRPTHAFWLARDPRTLREYSEVNDGRDVAGEIAVLVHGALAGSTRRTYTAAETLLRDILFGQSVNPCNIYPLTGGILLAFVYVTDKVGYPYSTIRTYVSGLKTRNLEEGYELCRIEAEHVKRALTAVKRGQPQGADRAGAKIAVTVAQARGAVITGTTGTDGEPADIVAIRLCLFGLLRCRECLALRCADVRFEATEGVVVACLNVRRSKVDQFGCGVCLRIGCVTPRGTVCRDALCAVHALYSYMCDGYGRGALQRDGMLFNSLTYSGLLRRVKALFGGASPESYGTHSLRRSGSQWMWRAGISNFEISQFGRWTVLDTLGNRYLNGVAK